MQPPTAAAPRLPTDRHSAFQTEGVVEGGTNDEQEAGDGRGRQVWLKADCDPNEKGQGRAPPRCNPVTINENLGV